tara:strand:- start:484 stop:717 length:234 start_codon:yes stop_codon:yes gene_type:complete
MKTYKEFLKESKINPKIITSIEKAMNKGDVMVIMKDGSKMELRINPGDPLPKDDKIPARTKDGKKIIISANNIDKVL